jgi:ADP-dependent NAD(P)H-hydrate dehydratase
MKAVPITRVVLKRMPLPEIDEAGDKNERGRVLIAGGSVETPGAVMLAGIAALRGGAGRLRIATCQSIAPYIATSVPEARVFGVAETKSGSISSSACPRLAELTGSVDALALGSGMVDDRLAVAIAKGLLKRIGETKILIDAAALRGLTDNPTILRRLKGQAVLTPHAGEMVALTGAREANVKKTCNRDCSSGGANLQCSRDPERQGNIHRHTRR